jgi:hypothetical protein
MPRQTWNKVNVNWDTTREALFRFLDLPAELRIMVYERLPITTRHHTFSHRAVRSRDDYVNDLPEDTDIDVSLVIKSLPVALLAICKQIHSEASHHMQPALERLRTEPMRLIVDTQSFAPLFQPRGFFFSAMRHCLTRLELGEVRPLISKYKMQALMLRTMRVSMKRSSTKARGLDKCEELAKFIRSCASLMHVRTPAFSIVAITPHEGCSLGEVCQTLQYTTGVWFQGAPLQQSSSRDDYYLNWNVLPGPVGFMLKESMTDEFDDPPSAEYPEGFWRAQFREEAGETSYGPPRFFAETVSETEWRSIWAVEQSKCLVASFVNCSLFRAIKIYQCFHLHLLHFSLQLNCHAVP